MTTKSNPVAPANNSTIYTSTVSLTKSASKPKDPLSTDSDRYIPNRKTTDLDFAHNQLTQESRNTMDSSDTQNEENVAKQLKNLNNAPGPDRILSYNSKIPECDNTVSLFTSHKIIPKYVTRPARYIPQEPIRILDAPDVINDYYLNLLDWNSNNLIAVALGTAVYIWNATSGLISKLCEFQNSNYPSSVSWSSSHKYLAVGTSHSEVQIWDTEALKLIRTMLGHRFRVGALAWCNSLLTSGSQNGSIIHHDPRSPDHFVCELSKHKQEVCGLRWSNNFEYLASGGNDNRLCIWDSNKLATSEPLHTCTHHVAAVKALAWCPWNNSLLASGGGTADRYIRIWNVHTGKCIVEEDTGSQISGIIWSERYKEIATSHGYTKHQLSLWRYPSLKLVGELTGHGLRILSAALSPDGTTVATLGADESIRFWKCFDEIQPRTSNKLLSKTHSQITHSL